MTPSGLSYLSEVCNIPLAEVARVLGVKRQTVNQWTGGKKISIPEKHIPKLIELFKLPPELYSIVNTPMITELDKTNVNLWIREKDLARIRNKNFVANMMKNELINLLMEQLKKEMLIASIRDKAYFNSKINEVEELIERLREHNNSIFNKNKKSNEE